MAPTKPTVQATVSKQAGGQGSIQSHSGVCLPSGPRMLGYQGLDSRRGRVCAGDRVPFPGSPDKGLQPGALGCTRQHMLSPRWGWGGAGRAWPGPAGRHVGAGPP